MNYQTYLSVVQDSLGTDQETAERATRARVGAAGGGSGPGAACRADQFPPGSGTSSRWGQRIGNSANRRRGTWTVRLK